MFKQQPMKMAAAEALWDGEAPAPFSVFAYGDVDKGHNKVAIEIPGLLSFLANDDFTSYVPGINDVNKAEQEKFGPGDYRPNIPVAYWGFRWMIGFGMASFAIGLLGLWLTRKKFLLPPALRTGEDEVPHLVLFRSKALEPAAHQVVLARRALDHGLPADRQLLGLDLHRDGPPALGRLRRAAHPRRGLPRRLPGRGAHLDDRLHRAVRRARRRSRSSCW